MKSIIVKLVIAAAAVSASLIATVGPAAAGGYGHHYPGPGYGGHHDRPHDRPHWRPLPPVCQPMHALDKARWNGLRRAHVEYVSRKRVVVAGYRHYGYDRMIFANRIGCPLIRR